MKTLTDIISDFHKPDANGFVILKPGFTQYKDQFLNILNDNGWKVLDTTLRKLTPEEVEQLYKDKKGEPYYDDLCKYMICDDCLCCSCYKDCEDPIKDMNELKEIVRNQWADDKLHNAMHSSDSMDNVKRECKICMEEKVEEKLVINKKSLSNISMFVEKEYSAKNGAAITVDLDGKYVFMMYDRNSGIVSCFAFDDPKIYASDWGLDEENANVLCDLKIGESLTDISDAIITRID